MGTIAGTLTQQEIQEAIQQAQQIASTATPTVQSGQFVFFAAFDGTNNDRNDLAESGTIQSTNVGLLEEMVHSQKTANPNLETGYYPGPGTDDTLFGSEALPWQVTQQVIDTASHAYNEFAAAASLWLQTNVGGSVTTMVASFSRGGAPAALFSQMLYEKGLVDPNTGAVLIPPGQVGVSGALLFDPVLTSVSGNMDFAPNTSNITVVRAMDEFRVLFPAAEYNDPRVTYVDFYGNHGDIGGFYDQGLGALTLEGATGYFQNHGLSIGEVLASRAFDYSQPVVYHTEGFDADGNILWNEYGSRGSRLTETVGYAPTAQVMADGSVVETFTLYDGREVKRTTDLSGNVSVAVVETGGQTLFDSVNKYGPAVTDALSLIRSIQSGEPLPIMASGLRLANSLENLDGIPNLELSGTANVASGLLSLMSLDAALDKGNTLGAITAGANALSFGAKAYLDFAESANLVPATSIESLNSFLNGSTAAPVYDAAGNLISPASYTPGVLPYLNIVSSIANGDPVGTVSGVLMLNPATAPLGIALSILNTIFSLFKDVPDPWGAGKVVWDGAGVGIDAVGETGGQEAVSGVMESVVATLNALIERVREQNPGSQLGIIPNRMPTVGYDLSGYRYTDIDPLTGEEQNPSLRFDVSGNPYNAEPGSPESFQSIVEGVVRSAISRGAIAPLWEVQTAKLQTDAGDPKAGLTEEERAARDGQLAAPVEGDTQIFRPVALDLDGDGIETVERETAGISFDVDDSGFLKSTGWLGADDACLTLDRNYNGQVDSGREMFSNSTVALGRRGLAGMAWVDANYDGKLTDADPVWDELRVWQDADGDGTVGAGESSTLADLGVTELNYSLGQFVQNGVTKQLASPDLEADVEGSRISAVPEGIIVESSSGDISLLVSRIDDKTAVEANRDGASGYEDVELIINSSDLVANDTVGGFSGRDLTVTGLTNFRHGTGFLDVNGFVHFVPEANYAGADAGFDYVARAENGQEGTGKVDITLQNTNDAPELGSVDHTTKPVYGYTRIQYDSETGEYLSGGVPIYQPYVVLEDWDGYRTTSSDPADFTSSWVVESHLTPVAQEDTGGGSVIGADIDDDPSTLTYEVVGQPQYGEVTVNADGTFQYTSWKEPGVPSDRIVVNGEYAGLHGGTLYTSSNLPGYAVYPTEDVFQVRITDPNGASTTELVSVPHYGPYVAETPQGGGKKPIAIDLDGDGFEFVNVDDSNVFFDVNGDGWKRRTSWIGADDGLLAYDIDGDGQIDKAGEIAFAQYKEGAQSDLEGLTAFDTNGDGLFTAADDKWASFGVWQDANQNGVTDAGEFRSLDEMGVASIGLTHDGQFAVINGQTVRGVGRMGMQDGSDLAIADVTFAYSNEVAVPQPDGTTQVVNASPFSPSGEVLEGTLDKDLILGKSGNNIVNGYAGDDVIFEDGGNDIIDAGDGNDIIYAGADNDLIMAGTGDDIAYAGLGNDVVFGGDGHDALFAEGGNDIVFGGAGNDLIAGGWGNDVLSGDDGNDQIYGESGRDALFGREGDDELSGMDGDDYLNGGAGYDLLDGGAGADEMIGGAGNDTYAVDDVNDVVTELAGEGVDTVRASIDYALGEELEHLTLSGSTNLTGIGNAKDNDITGNSGNNVLRGEAGDDRLNGGKGVDTLIGGQGDDAYVVDDSADVVVELEGEGVDSIYATASYVLPEHVENLTLTGQAAISGTGNDLINKLVGNRGDNLLDGGAAADTMMGGKGNDTYVVDRHDDVVVESEYEGVDTVQTDISYTLGANLENLVLTGTADLSGVGNAASNLIVGNEGNNLIDGGEGADTLFGGQGDDTYLVDSESDTVIENGYAGDDHVIASVTYTLSDNIEQITLTGMGDIDATGNALDNTMKGNVGANRLDGGAGADMMAGDGGDDTYVVDDVGDTVIETADAGVDSVLSSVSFVLPEHVENLTLAGASAIDGSGNDLDNILVGNDAANVLLGGAGSDSLDGHGGDDTLDGGTSGDHMAGGAGDDIYYVDDTGDVVVETIDGGYDTVRTSISLVAPENVERIELLGSSDIDAIGNDLDNMLIGNVGANRLDGGLGADSMSGGNGDDAYIIDNAGDTVSEGVGEGDDHVFSGVTYALTVNVERLTLTGTGDINGTGNALDNALTGNAGANRLDGGAGVDEMVGGAGDDDYIVDNVADTVVEAAAEGVDTIYTSVSYVLPEHVENLILTDDGNINAGGNGLDNVLVGNSGDNTIAGGGGNDTLDGGVGNDTLEGGAGNDVLTGGTGDDTYLINLGDGLDRIVDVEGNDTVHFGEGLSLDNVALRVTQNDAGYQAYVRVLNADGCEQPDQGFDFAVTLDADGRYVSPIEVFQFADGSDQSFDDLLIKTRYTYGSARDRVIVTGRDDDVIYAGPKDNTVHSGSGHDVVFGQQRDDVLYGEGGNDYLQGGTGDDTIDSGCGFDVLSGGNGDDSLQDGDGNSALLGGRGRDVLSGGKGNDFIAGGKHDDILDGGAGANIFAFSDENGRDTILPFTGSQNTLSLGDVDYDELAFRKTGDDLILETDDDSRITFKDWYASTDNHNFVTLQIIQEWEQPEVDEDHDENDQPFKALVESFDFQALVDQYDAARLANPKQKSWQLLNGLLDAHLESSDTMALGGDLAFHYAQEDSLEGMGVLNAQSILKESGFGKQAQTIRPGASVNSGSFTIA